MMLSGKPPFGGRTPSQIETRVIRGKYNLSSYIWKTISIEAKRFIKRLLEYDPDKRVSAAQAVKDPWFNKLALRKLDRRTTKVAVEILKNLQNFQAKKTFQDAVWVFMVSHFAAEDEKQKLTKVFSELDENKDGNLTKEEIIAGKLKNEFLMIIGYKKFNLNDISEEEINEIFARIDRNSNGSLDYSGEGSQIYFLIH
jgi:Serine/threonine protein kinase